MVMKANDWERYAFVLGYKKEDGTGDEIAMLRDLYSRMSMEEMSESLAISPHSLRRKLLAEGITLRKRGGANNRRCVVDDAIVERMKNEGATQVAKDLQVSKYTLFKQRRRFLAGKPTAAPMPPDDPPGGGQNEDPKGE